MEPMKLDAVNRIVDEVGRAFVPDNLDKQKLLKTLKFCATWRKTQINFKKADIKRHKQRLAKIRKKAEQLQKLLSEERCWLSIPGGQKLIEALDEMLEPDISLLTSEVGPRDQPTMPLVQSWTTRSPTEWLAGHHLPRVFEKFFDRPPGRSFTNDQQPSGPCVRFIFASLREMEINFKAHSIVRAITDARAEPRARRRR